MSIRTESASLRPFATFADLAAAIARRHRGVAWLDSGLPLDGLGRFSFLAFDPFHTFTARADDNGRDPGDPLAALRGELARHSPAAAHASPPHPLFPFAGGAIGYISYETGARLERIAPAAPDELGLPDLAFHFYDGLIAHDHATGETTLVANPVHRAGAPAILARLRAALAGAAASHSATGNPPSAIPAPAPVPDLSRAAYDAAIARIRALIASGDVYQVNFTQRFTTPFPPPVQLKAGSGAAWKRHGHPAHDSGEARASSPCFAPDTGGAAHRPRPGWPCHMHASPSAETAAAIDLHLRLRQRSPAPFAAYLDFGDHRIVSSSPERFLQKRGPHLETRPIKGTRPRGATPADDARLRADLAASEKDRAELLMIVDLERNDLGRVCRPGTVHVEDLYRLEPHPTVHHLVATVRGELAPGRDLFDALRATLPGGSITGAPKIRAMQIINALEPVRRHVYTGAIGWIGFNGDADLNIAIRTITCARGRAYYHVGGGIVQDSSSASEYQETLDKGRAMHAALTGF
ncbi:para-aminobenzoate synthase [Opitutaceae bacterium TAV5]|nr:para-aminobenzoate synthase [Opitutaceae bacterium TAV5]